MFNGRRASAGEDEEVPDGIVGMVVQQCELFNTTTHKSGSVVSFMLGIFHHNFLKVVQGICTTIESHVMVHLCALLGY